REDDEKAAVELRDEADRRLAEFIEAKGDDAGVDHEHQNGEADGACRQPAIAARQGAKITIEPAEKSVDRLAPPAIFFWPAMRLEQQRAYRRRQRQRHGERDD